MKSTKFIILIVMTLFGTSVVGRFVVSAQISDQRLNLMLTTLPAAQDPQRYKGYVEPKYREFAENSAYLTMHDGVKIAVTVVLPKDLAANEKIPAIMHMTRYWRATQDQKLDNSETRFFCGHGYGLVSVDARGTGASFGVWRAPFTQDEVRDYNEIADWIVAQPWSNGKIGAIGNSYDGNAALWLATTTNPAVKAVIPRHFEFDEYAETPYPGGVLADWLMKTWNESNHKLDNNKGAKLVDEDKDGLLFRGATEHRKENLDVYAAALKTGFRDDRDFASTSLDELSVHTYRAQIEKSRTAINSWGGWFDASTADAVIKSFINLTNYQRAIIGPWNHGGGQDASPYQAVTPERVMQGYEWLRFFDHYLKGTDTGLDSEKTLYYFTMGEEKWKATNTWPVAGTKMVRWYLDADNTLSAAAPQSTTAEDRYRINFDATSGTKNRWHTQVGGQVSYPNRADEDKKLLTYTSSSLTADTEITGYPIIDLFMTSNNPDGAFFVYFEEVDERGTVTYITEGELRALDRKISTEQSPLKTLVPYHSFLGKDAMQLEPGKTAELKFGLLPTSVLIRKGHRLRIAIAGADKDTFARIPKKEAPTITVERNRDHPSLIEIPLIERN